MEYTRDVNNTRENIANTSNNTSAIKYSRYQPLLLLKRITNTFVAILFIVYYIQKCSFLHGHLFIKLMKRLLSRNGKVTTVYNDLMLMSKHCSNIIINNNNKHICVVP